MNNVFVVFLTIIICGIYASAQTKATALSILTKSEPAVKWNAKSEIKGDFDYDGVADYALRGREGKFFVLGIVKGALSGKSKHYLVEFGEDAGDQGALCSVNRAVITVENLDENYAKFAADYLEKDSIKTLESLSKKSKGINIADGMCDSFHTLWDQKTNRFFWWRI